MTKAAAIHTFLSGFGLTAYDAFSVPSGEDAPVMPYLTYGYSNASFGDGETPLQVNLWYLTDSNVAPNAKAQELSDCVGRGGRVLPCDGGAVWIKRGSPFCQSLQDQSDPRVKRRYINLTAEFLTAD